jgi:hypothetical protein
MQNLLGAYFYEESVVKHEMFIQNYVYYIIYIKQWGFCFM